MELSCACLGCPCLVVLLSHFAVHPTGRAYGEIVQTLADRALAAAEKAGTRHYMIGIAGSPGSGKSTLAQLVCHAINQKVQQQGKGKPSVMVPMDGFHLYRWQLDQMPHPEVRVRGHKERGIAASN